MTLKREAYEPLKNVVGAENISEDSAVIQSYLLQWATDWFGDESKLISVVPDAVVLPGSTEEVQAVVKICNRYKVKFKAHSTGWGAWAIPVTEGSIILDLRRMNRIIKIDEKNMYAVIEPYVTARELQAEAMKKGLTCLTIGAGCQCSPLASVTSGWGHGTPANTMSYSNRNFLGFEWVTPTGEIVRGGTVEEGKFLDPGIGLRGIFRGFIGVAGGLGVFTKCATKLYPWPGQAVPEVTGSSPKYRWKIPDNVKIYMLTLPSLEKYADAVYKLNEEEITYIIWSYALSHMIVGLSVSNNNYYDIWTALPPDIIKENLYPLQVMITANSKKELEYKEKVLKDIMDETSAEDFLPQLVTEELKELLYVMLVTQYCHGLIFRLSGGTFGTSFGYVADWDSCVRGIKAGCEIKEKHVEDGKLFDDAVQGFWGGPKEQGRLAHSEGIFCQDPADLDSVRAGIDYVTESVETEIKEKLLCGGPIVMVDPQVSKTISPNLSDFYGWVKKIKKTFDPNNVSEASAYTGKG